MRWILIVVVALLCGCGTEKKKTVLNIIETVEIKLPKSGDNRTIPVYCHFSAEIDGGLYFITNSYTVNLPQGWGMETANRYHLHSYDKCIWECRLATDNFPEKTYVDFNIYDSNREAVTIVRLPIFSTKWKQKDGEL